MRETRVQVDPLEKEMATHSSILSWKIPQTEEPGELQSMGSQRVGHNWETNTEKAMNYMCICACDIDICVCLQGSEDFFVALVLLQYVCVCVYSLYHLFFCVLEFMILLLKLDKLFLVTSKKTAF